MERYYENLPPSKPFDMLAASCFDENMSIKGKKSALVKPFLGFFKVDPLCV